MKGEFQGKLALISKWLEKDCGRVLDVGCSSGYFSNYLLTKSKEVYAIDTEKDSIEFAKDHYKDVKFNWASIEKAPYPKEYFDTIVALDVIEHCKDDKKAIWEIKRILKRGGRLILSVPYKGPLEKFDIENVSFNFPNLTKLFVMITYKLSRTGKYKSWRDMYRANFENSPHHRHYNALEISRLLGRQFRVTRLRRAGGLLFALLRTIDVLFLMSGKLRPLRRVTINIMNYDYLIDYGPFSYSLILEVKKLLK